MRSRLEIVRKLEGRSCHVRVAGAMSDAADFSALVFQDIDAVDFDLAGVTSINSMGIMHWVRMLQTIPKTIQVTLSRCSVVISHQLRVFPLFLDGGRIKIRSLSVEYECDACRAELTVLIEANEAAGSGALPQKTCPECGKTCSPCWELPQQFAFVG